MRMLMVVILLVVMMAPPPPLLPRRPGPATLRQARVTCSTTIDRTAHPRVCVRGWGLR